jgi:hypothetical protein
MYPHQHSHTPAFSAYKPVLQGLLTCLIVYESQSFSHTESFLRCLVLTHHSGQSGNPRALPPLPIFGHPASCLQIWLTRLPEPIPTLPMRFRTTYQMKNARSKSTASVLKERNVSQHCRSAAVVTILTCSVAVATVGIDGVHQHMISRASSASAISRTACKNYGPGPCHKHSNSSAH